MRTVRWTASAQPALLIDFRPMRLLLIRHGQSEHSVRRIVASGQVCPGLTDRGRQQAELLRARLAAEQRPIDVVLSSPVPRARETLRIVLPALTGSAEPGAGGSDEPDVDCGLCE